MSPLSRRSSSWSPSSSPSHDTAGLGGLVKTPSLPADLPPPPQSLADTRDRLRLFMTWAGSPSPRGSLRLVRFGVRGDDDDDDAAGAASHASSVTSWLRTTAPLLNPTSVRGRDVSGLVVAPFGRSTDCTDFAAVLRRASRWLQADPSGRSDHGENAQQGQSLKGDQTNKSLGSLRIRRVMERDASV